MQLLEAILISLEGLRSPSSFFVRRGTIESLSPPRSRLQYLPFFSLGLSIWQERKVDCSDFFSDFRTYIVWQFSKSTPSVMAKVA